MKNKIIITISYSYSILDSERSNPSIGFKHFIVCMSLCGRVSFEDTVHY